MTSRKCDQNEPYNYLILNLIVLLNNKQILRLIKHANETTAAAAAATLMI